MRLQTKIVLYYSLLLFLLASCVTQRKVEKWNKKNPDKAAEYCAETFPVKDSLIVRDSIRFDTLYLELEPEIIRDSFFIKGDTVIRQVTKACPPVRTIVKTVTRDSIVIRRDRAYETVQQNELFKVREQVAKLNADLHQKEIKIGEQKERIKEVVQKKWIFLILFLALLGWNLRKPISRIISPLGALLGK